MASNTQVYGGRYEIVRQIARGGMAEVYLARDQLLDRRVALKMLFPELSTDRNFVERFRREAQAAANLSHPNIVSVYDWGEEAGNYFIVMEFIDGRPLSQVIRSDGPLLADRAADIGAETAGALAFAHRNGVVHRDVKPGNVLIDADDRVKVADFGIARAASGGTGENLTQTGAVMGTATYFSPEQAQGFGVDARSDVYSLGVVLYEMVTGQPPFTGDNPVTVAYKHVSEQPVPPRQINADVSPAFEAITLQAMAKDPAQRYATAEELRADLLRFRQGRQVAAVPPAAATAAIAQTQVAGATQAIPATAIAAETEEKRRTGSYVALLFVMLAALAVLLFLLAKQLGVGEDDPAAPQVAVPTVVDKPIAEAEQLLRAAGFEPQKTYEKNAKAKDIVFDQDPDGGVNADKGTVVNLKVSEGEQTVRIPRVVGLKEQDAREELTGAGFRVGTVESQPNDNVAAGIVLEQDPKSGEMAPPDSSVNLIVSAGKERVKVPDVKGKDAAAAANDLGRAGLETKTVREASDTVEEGKVIRTEPPAGTEVEKGSTVTLVVSSGKAQVVVPDVVGLKEAEATKKLTDAGFKVVKQDQAVADPDEDGRVQDQDPKGDAKADQGSTVTIFIGRVPVDSG